jgi:hypothetical protein
MLLRSHEPRRDWDSQGQPVPLGCSNPFALIPAARVAGDPEGSQGLSRLQQMPWVRMPTKSREAAVREPAWSRGSLGPQGPQVAQGSDASWPLFGALVPRGSQVVSGMALASTSPMRLWQINVSLLLPKAVRGPTTMNSVALLIFRVI